MESHVESLEHFPISMSFEDGSFVIHQQVGATADEIIAIRISADQAKQIGRFLLKEREQEHDPDAPGADDGFDQFWSAYPRKDGKARALDIWKRHRLGGKLQVVIAHLTAIKQSPQWTDQGGRFVPHAGTYLSQRRYLDEVESEDYSLFK